MNTYKHLTLYEREKIMAFHVLGKTIIQIAHQLQRHKSTISLELRRYQSELLSISDSLSCEIRTKLTLY
ncbi:helix-turn-helix domain-containing protein [Avibacterium avium]|uniref:helix-turn-helix domain-containing protein n=1 Tax=Avibacterium avium TaxID=751 RepID=UPI0039FC418F